MDVTCNRCGTVYEFEEALVVSMGMTVKCTDCGHLFKVASGSDPAPPVTPLPPKPSARWRVRSLGESPRQLESLGELSALIEAGELVPDDEISRTGERWKRLGSIAELEPLFDAARARRGRERASDLGLAGRSRAAEPARPGRPRRRTPRSKMFESMGEEIPLDGDPAPAQLLSTPTTVPPPPPPDRSGPPPSVAPPEAKPLSSAPPAPGPLASTAAVPSARPEIARGPGDHEVDLNEITQPLPVQRTRRGPYFWLLIGLPLALGAGLAGTLLMRTADDVSGAASNPVREFLERGDEAFASHEPQRMQHAITEYTKALAFHDDDPHILSSISRTYAVWAQLLRFRLEYVRLRGDGTEVELVNLEGEVRRLAQQAKEYAEQAARRNPGNEESEVALSDALRLTGNLVGARAELDRARAHESVASSEALRVAALLAIDEAQGDYRAGAQLAERSVKQDSTSIRAHLLFARALIASAEPGRAKLQLDAVRRVAPDLAALDELDGRAALAQKPAAGAVDAQPSAAPDTAPDADADDELDGEAAREAGKQEAAQGEAALVRGAVGTAQSHFERALELSPNYPRAYTGLGYVALERSRPRLAVRQFRRAKQRGHAEAFIGLGDAYRRLGQVEDALEAYEAYVVRFPNGARRSIAQRQIELLREQRGANPGGANGEP